MNNIQKELKNNIVKLEINQSIQTQTITKMEENFNDI